MVPTMLIVYTPEVSDPDTYATPPLPPVASLLVTLVFASKERRFNGPAIYIAPPSIPALLPSIKVLAPIGRVGEV
jgi:hypothetical protein